MLSQKDILTYLKENKKLFQKNYHVSQIGLFGSFARGEAQEESDIDLIIEFDGEVDIYETKMAIKRELKEKFHREVDLCRAKYLKSFVKDKILKEAIYV